MSEGLAVRLFGRLDVVGRTVRHVNGDGQSEGELIGVVADTRFESVLSDMAPIVYESGSAVEPAGSDVVLLIRTASAPRCGIDGQRGERHLAFSVLVRGIAEFKDVTNRQRSEIDGLARIVAVLAGLAGLTAGLGLYSVVALETHSRRRDFAIRLALGATPHRIRQMVLSRAAVMGLAGITIGSVAGWGVSAITRREIGRRAAALSRGCGEQPPRRSWPCALVAAAIPARRATRTDIANTLRMNRDRSASELR